MPKIDRTERGVTTRATYQPYDTGRGGQAIGEGISRLGAAISSLAAGQEEQAMFDAKMKVSEYTFQQTAKEDDRIANYNPALHGPPDQFDSRYLQERQEQDAKFISQFSGKAQQYAALQVQQNRHSTALRMQNARQGFVMQENIGRIGALGDRIGASLTGDPESVGEGLQTLFSAIDAIPGLTPAQRNALRAREAPAMWKRWLQKRPSLEQQKRALTEFEAGYEKWSKQFEEDAVPGGALTPGARNIRRDTELDGRTAAVRYNNPGAQYPSAAAEKFGMTGYGIIGGGHKIAMFPSDVHGGAANMDNFARHYKGLTFAEAVSKWRGGNGSVAVPEGFDPRARVDDAFLADRERMADFFDKMSRHEGRGRAGPVPRETWNKAFDMYRAGGIKAEPARGQVASAGGPLTGTPVDETGGDGKPRVYQKQTLSERATGAHHAINGFMDIIPALRKSIDEEEARLRAISWFGDVASGRVQANKYDPENRKTIDQLTRDAKLGERIFAGDGQAIAGAAAFAKVTGYLPAPALEGLRGLVDDADLGKQEIGWRVIDGILRESPNALATHEGDEKLVQRNEHVRQMARLYGMQEGLKRIAAERDPEVKAKKRVLKDDVEKILKNYEGDKAGSQIMSDMTEGKLEWLFSQPDVRYLPETKALAEDDYRTILRRELEAGATETEAKAAAISQFKNTYGVSHLFGAKRVMRYPPERLYGEIGGSHKWIEDEIKKEVGTYIPSAQMDQIFLKSDARTEREYDRWRRGLGPPPSYVLDVKREDGRREYLRFQPDFKAAQAARIEELKQQRYDRVGDPFNPKEAPTVEPGGGTPTERQTEALRSGGRVRIKPPAVGVGAESP